MTVTDVSSGSSESPDRLPRGRHGIAAEVVAASQHERLLRAVVQVVGERGWSETRIADVVAAAAVSRRTFYERFDGLEACFIAAIEAGFAQLMAAIDDRSDAADLDFEGRVRRFFTTYLELIETTPGAMRALHVEAVRATDAIRVLHDRVIETVGDRLLVARFGDGARDVPDDYGVLLVGGFEHLLSRRIRRSGEAPLAEIIENATAIAVRALA
jgi:AcrR family transcriptional regulator